MGALETYLSDLLDTKLSGEGVDELSYYPALRQLLEEVGAGPKSKVRCFMNLKDHGAGLPDGLSYREKALLRRDLKVEEVREVMRMARRIAAILLLQPALDANYLAVKEKTYAWKPEKG